MALRKIRWKEADDIKLRQAVDKFNKIIDSSSDKEYSMLPDKVDYETIKESILTRKGLEDQIASLNRLSKENATNVHVTSAGLQISEYHWNEAKIAEKKWKRRLEKEKFELSEVEEGKEYSRVAMGDPKAKRVLSNLDRNIINELDTMDDTYHFNEKFNSLMNRVSEDERYRKTLQYKENYMSLIEANYSNFENYDIFYERVKDMTPLEFYKLMQADEYTEDIYYQSNQHYNQPNFNKFLMKIGILDKKGKPIKKR